MWDRPGGFRRGTRSIWLRLDAANAVMCTIGYAFYYVTAKSQSCWLWKNAPMMR